MRDEDDISTEEEAAIGDDSARTVVLKIERKMKHRTKSISIKILREVGEKIKNTSLLLFIIFSNWGDKK